MVYLEDHGSKEFNLSAYSFYINIQPLKLTMDHDLYRGKDVKEFIKRLKEVGRVSRIDGNVQYIIDKERLDKLAGEKLK